MGVTMSLKQNDQFNEAKKEAEEFTKEDWQRWYAHKSNKELVIEAEEE
jgi:hypothetical protein